MRVMSSLKKRIREGGKINEMNELTKKWIEEWSEEAGNGIREQECEVKGRRKKKKGRDGGDQDD